MSHSPDRRWWWDGGNWSPAVSPDGAWWFDGRDWVPNRPARFRREPTAWTRQLQGAVIGLEAVGLVAGAFAVTSYVGPLNDYFQSAAAAPPGTDPAAYRHFFETVTLVTFGFAGVVTVGLLAVIVIGTLKRWSWVYWYLMVTGALAVLGLPSQVVQLFGVGLPMAPGGRTLREPAGLAVLEILLELAWLGMFVWMIRAYRRYGVWAMRKLPLQVSIPAPLVRPVQ